MTDAIDTAEPPAPRAIRAIAMLMISIAIFDFMSVFVRLLLPRFAPQELSVYRNVLGAIPSLLLMARAGQLQLGRRGLYIPQWRTAVLRGLAVTVAQFLLYTSLGLLELATVSALEQTTAFFVVIYSIVLLGDRVGAWRWSALALGFVGAIWVIRPGADTFHGAALLPVAAASGYALSMVLVRRIDKKVSNALIYLYASSASAAGAIVLTLTTTGFSPITRLTDIFLILGMAACGGVAVLFNMLAFRMAMPSILAPFAYFSLLTSFSYGWLFFGEAPVDRLFPGVLLIVAAGGMIMWREHGPRKPGGRWGKKIPLS